ncbi:unnamed protein product [Linum trigynum]|uniref:Uncharacterized protein n=1 Tax=Linum trigynum TaxID=586398 RepID=A0AAV2GFC8_9ROSI
MGTGTAAERCSALEAAFEEMQAGIATNTENIANLTAEVTAQGARMTRIEAMMETVLAKLDAWIPQREGKGAAGNGSDEESSEEKEGEKSTTGMKIGERSTTGPKTGEKGESKSKFDDGSGARHRDSAVQGSFGVRHVLCDRISTP